MKHKLIHSDSKRRNMFQETFPLTGYGPNVFGSWKHHFPFQEECLSLQILDTTLVALLKCSVIIWCKECCGVDLWNIFRRCTSSVVILLIRDPEVPRKESLEMLEHPRPSRSHKPDIPTNGSEPERSCPFTLRWQLSSESSSGCSGLVVKLNRSAAVRRIPPIVVPEARRQHSTQDLE
jgi:hypothetical protein